MSQRKRLLFLSHRLPFPPHNGASIRTFNTLKQLAQQFDITALCFDRGDVATGMMPVATRIEGIAPYASVEVFPIPQESSSSRRILDHVRSILTGRAYTYYLHDSPAFEDRLRYHLTTGFDLVHVDSMDLVRFASMLGSVPAICTHHNVESALLRRRATVAGSGILRAYMNHQAMLLEREERKTMGTFTLNIAVSAEDEAEFQRIVPGLKTAVIPNGVDVGSFQPGVVKHQGCVFVGGTSWFPNKDGLAWFSEMILPELNHRGWNSEVVWVGRATTDEIADYNRIPGIRLVGYVEDIRPYVTSAACFLVPLRVGGGTRLKVLDAWAMGKAVVSTSLGAEGLEARHGENIILADSPAAFAEAVIQVLHDASLREKLGRNARETAVRRYSWDGLGEVMRSLYAMVLEASPSMARR